MKLKNSKVPIILPNTSTYVLELPTEALITIDVTDIYYLSNDTQYRFRCKINNEWWNDCVTSKSSYGDTWYCFYVV